MSYVRPTPSQIQAFPPTYKAAYLKLLDDYENSENDKILILQEFSQKHILISHFWDVLKKLEKMDGNNPYLKNVRKSLFFSSIKYGYSWDLKLTVTNGLFEPPFRYTRLPSYERFELAKKIMSFPNAFTATALWFYQKYGTKPLPKSIIKKSEKAIFFYNEFMKDDLTDEQFLNYLKEIHEDDVVIGILEHRLGWKMGCSNKKIWKFYINFLQNKEDHFALLDVYRRYTRFFIEDIEMIEKYRNEIQLIGKTHAVFEFWIDTILFEVDFGVHSITFQNSKLIEILKRAMTFTTGKPREIISPLDLMHTLMLYKKSMDVVEKDKIQNIKIQEVPFNIPPRDSISTYYPKKNIQFYKRIPKMIFPSSFIYHICKAANYDVLQKLFCTCKFFFATRPKLICHHLLLSAYHKKSSEFIDQSLYIDKEFKIYDALKDLVVTKQITLLDNSNDDAEKMLSKFKNLIVS